jgi:hypothetical protein
MYLKKLNFKTVFSRHFWGHFPSLDPPRARRKLGQLLLYSRWFVTWDDIVLCTNLLG